MQSFRVPRIAVFATLPLLAVAATAAAAEKFELRPRLDPATRHYINSNVEVKRSISGGMMGDRTMVLTTGSTRGAIERVTRSGSTWTLEFEFDRAAESMASAMLGDSDYDSDHPDDPEASPYFKTICKAMVGKSVTLTLDDKFALKSCTGMEPIAAEIDKDAATNPMWMNLKAEYTDAKVGKNWGTDRFVIYPDRPVAVGDTWTASTSEANPQIGGSIVIQFTMTLDGIDDTDGRRTANISFTGTIGLDTDGDNIPESVAENAPKPDDASTDEEAPPAGPSLKGTVNGHATYDFTTGRITQREQSSQFNFKGGAAAGDMKVDGETKFQYALSTLAERERVKKELETKRLAERAKKEAEQKKQIAAAKARAKDNNASDGAKATPVNWTCWGGPHGDWTVDSAPLAFEWPKDGPKKLWSRDLGDGYSSITYEDGTLYTAYSVRDKDDAAKGREVIVALDAANGKTLWEYGYDAPYVEDMQMEFGPGPHATPLVLKDRVIVAGVTALLHCVDKKTGSLLWTQDLYHDYGAGPMGRGYSASALAYKDTVILPIGKEGQGVMAFKQSDGSVAWKAQDFGPTASSPILIDVDGQEQLVVFADTGAFGLNPNNGEQYWTLAHPTQYGANISTPVWCPKEKTLFVSSAYGMGSRGVLLTRDGDKTTASERWFNPKMKIHHGNAVLVGDTIYGSSGDFGPAFLAAVDIKTGEFDWKERGFSKATLLYADHKLIVLDEDGKLAITSPRDDGLTVLSEATLLDKVAWTVPTLVGKTLFVRDRKQIMAIDLG